ncbi:hypothetical protein HHI36_008028 [Cryptolaemus montrouzieri]|uniref:Uncharacterized protein n=1 Tax=Cryptolaemus montrouzieri TaxID=559131 RepID=A0ABD2MRU6_9CUCU
MQKVPDIETQRADTYAQQLKRAFPPVPERQEKNKGKHNTEKAHRETLNTKSSTLTDMENTQLLIMKDVINLGKTENAQNNTQIKNKQKNIIPQRQIGTSKEMNVSSEEFQGRRMKGGRVWIFLSRVEDTATEDIIKQHIVQSTNSKEEVIVQNIETYHKVKDNNCFQIGVSFQFKDTVYENSFWPTGVLFSRYNFSLQPRSTGTNQNNTNFQAAVPSQGQP